MSKITLLEHGIGKYTQKLVSYLNQGYKVVPNTSRVRGSLFSCDLEGENVESEEVPKDDIGVVDETQPEVEYQEFFEGMTKKKIIEYVETNYSQTLDSSLNKENLVSAAVEVAQGE